MESVIPVAYLCGVMSEVLEMARIASDVRMRANLRHPSFSTRQMIRAWFPNAIVTGRDLPEGVQEIVTMTDVGPFVVYRRDLSGCAQRFAIAHALGHLLHDFDSRGRIVASLADPRVETRADNFALELLAPIQMVKLHADDLPTVVDEIDQEDFLDRIDGIASRFHVPAWAIAKQVRRLRD